MGVVADALRLLEQIRARAGFWWRQVLCTGCSQAFPELDVTVVPWWNDSADNYVTAYRCYNCVASALADTRARLAAADDHVAKVCSWFERNGVVVHENRRGDSADVVRPMAERLLSMLRDGTIVLPIGHTSPIGNVNAATSSMDDMRSALASGDYLRAYEALQRSADAHTQVGMATGGFLLALAGRYDDADRMLANLPGIALIARGGRARLARWSDPSGADGTAVSVPLPFVGMYAEMARALAQRDEVLLARLKADMQQIPPVRGTIFLGGKSRRFNDLVDADDAIGRMLETYYGNGLLYFPFATLRRVEFLPKTNFMDILMPKAQITDLTGNVVMAYVPLLYAGSSLHPDEMIRNGRTTTFDYVGAARRASGQRDFFADSAMIGLQNVTAIEFD